MEMIRTANFGKIGVLMGGPSTEREISFRSGRAVYQSLKQLGLDVVAIDIKTDDTAENISLLKEQKIDCAFIALHGYFGEDGQIQEILDILGIAYTGSGKLASQLAMDKVASRQVLKVHGLSVPRYKVLERLSYSPAWKAGLPAGKAGYNFSFPLVVKPSGGGSSIGLSIVDTKDQIDKALDLAFSVDDKVLIEEYISGREMTVGILNEKALPVIEIVPKKRFFDYEAKYQPGMTDYLMPAPLDESSSKRLQSTALLVHRLLGCLGYSRVDMILAKDDSAFILELNSIPGFTPTSLLPKAALLAGIGFSQLCVELIKIAYEKAKTRYSESLV